MNIRRSGRKFARYYVKMKYFIYLFITVLLMIPILVRLKPEKKEQKIQISQISENPENKGKNSTLDSENINKLSTHLTTVFDMFWPFCKDADEIKVSMRGETTCLYTFGLKSFALESLETLYIANMTDKYEEVSKYIKENSKCEEFGAVDIRDFWTIYIGSLIGTYRVTGDKDFLEMGTKCSKLAIDIINEYNETMSYINFKGKYMKKYSYAANASSLSEATAGLPELMELYKITDDNVFLDEYYKRLAFIPLKTRMPLSTYYDPITKETKQHDAYMDGNIMGFLNDIVTASRIKDLKVVTNFLNASIRYMDFISDAFLYDAMLIQERAFEIGIEDRFVQYSESYRFLVELFPPLSKIFFNYDGNSHHDYCFRFHSASLRWFRTQIKDVKSLISCAELPMKRNYFTKCYGLTGVPHETRIVSSNVIGQWLKEAFLIITNTTAVVNENNHILEFK